MTSANERAFPGEFREQVVNPHTHEGWEVNRSGPGLTKREYFAAKILSGILAGDLPRALVVGGPTKTAQDWGRDLPLMAVEFADLLIQSLNKEAQNG